MQSHLFAPALLLCLAGCAAPEADGGTVRFAGLGFGPPLPADPSDIRRSETRILGLWIESNPEGGVVGAGFGWRDRRVVAAPLDCRVVFFVETEAQLAAARRLTMDLAEKGLKSCASQ